MLLPVMCLYISSFRLTTSATRYCDTSCLLVCVFNRQLFGPNISKTVADRVWVRMDHWSEMAYGKSISHMIHDVTWPVVGRWHCARLVGVSVLTAFSNLCSHSLLIACFFLFLSASVDRSKLDWLFGVACCNCQIVDMHSLTCDCCCCDCGLCL